MSRMSAAMGFSAPTITTPPYSDWHPLSDPTSREYDKAVWDEQFERECGYLPNGSPWEHYRALVEHQQRVQAGMQATHWPPLMG